MYVDIDWVLVSLKFDHHIWCRKAAMKEKRETQLTPKQNSNSQSRRTYKVLSTLYNLFYTAFGCAFLIVVAFSMQSESRYAAVLGYSMFHVETRSMDSVMPRGSLLIIHEVDKDELMVGDDITFFEPTTNPQDTAGRLITHRIINIDEKTSQKERFFQTKGVDNPAPDKEKVNASNVVGKVVFTIPGLGIYLTYIKEHAVMVVGMCVLFLVFIKLCVMYVKEKRTEAVLE